MRVDREIRSAMRVTRFPGVSALAIRVFVRPSLTIADSQEIEPTSEASILEL